MSLSAEERAARRDSFRRMKPAEKAEYLFSYYKLPIFLALLAVYVLCYGTYRHFTAKDTLLYAACFNVAVGEDADALLSEGFARFLGEDTRKREVYVYHDLYLSDDPAPENHEYAYASRLKLMAAVNAEQMDVVFLNREAYDILSAEGYLLDLEAFLSGQSAELLRRVQPYLTENEVIVEDNALEVRLNEAETYQAVTETRANGVKMTGFPVFRDLGFSGEVYCGVIQNSPRQDTAANYISYLAPD